MSEEPDTSFPDIEAPRQRLATTKPRTEVSIAAKRTQQAEAATRQTVGRSLADDSPHVRTTSARTASTKSTQRSTDSRAEASAPSRSELASKDRRTSSSQSRPASTKSSTARDKVASQTAAKRPTRQAAVNVSDEDKSELMAAFSDYPPEVQKQALQQLVAASAMAAKRTGQPNSLEDSLDGIKLPTLPEPKQKRPTEDPRRLAKSKSAAKSTVESVADASSEKSIAASDYASGHVSDLVTTDLESTVVQSIPSTQDEATSEVKAASATISSSDESMIARAAVEDKPLIEEVDAKPKKSASELESTSTPSTDRELYATLLKRLANTPAGETEAQRSSRMIKLRHMMVLAGQPDDAVGKIEGMSESEQEFLRHQLLGLWTMIDPDGHPVPSRRFSTAVPQIRQAAQFAAAATDALEVRSLAFCTEIESYGQIKPFENTSFDAGQQVIMYCEIENFTAEKSTEGYETHLQGSYDVYNSENEKVVSQLLPADNQVSSNYLRDYFIAYQMHLPQQLTSGKYRMQLTVEDVKGKKYGQASLPFEIKK
ncbi:MAG: hypothetical protein AB8B91_08715 [Rubripirellula sp.]